MKIMKRKITLCAWALSLMLLAGCSQEKGQMSYIGADAAKKAALEDAGQTASGVESLTADLKNRNGQDYYQIDFTVDGKRYQYDIDALTGVVIEADSSNTAVASSTAADASAATDADKAVGAGTIETKAGTNTNSGTEIISEEDAKTNALTHAGLTSDQVTFVKNKLDYENGRQVYDVEFYTADYKEYDYEIDALTGEVLSYDYEAEGYTAQNSSGSQITEEKAKELALAQVPGATADDIREFKTDYDDGHFQYEGKIIYNGMEYEFEIDGYSGAIRSWEAEDVKH